MTKSYGKHTAKRPDGPGSEKEEKHLCVSGPLDTIYHIILLVKVRERRGSMTNKCFCCCRMKEKA